MNINEDKFANKSAEEIVNDMLTQHKNNSKEALEHINDILKNDGLVLSSDIKDKLQGAATLLADKGLKEGWFKKELPREDVLFTVYLPFKKEPVKFVTRATSLDDPIIKDALAKIRKKHPHSPINIDSTFGHKTIFEDKTEDKHPILNSILSSDVAKNIAATGLSALTGGAISPIFMQSTAKGALDATKKRLNKKESYQLAVYNENKQIYNCMVGNLPIAMALAENISNTYKKVDISKEDKVICSYDKELNEWTINQKENELKEDIYTNDDITTHSYADLKKDIADLDERTKVILCKLNPNLIDKRKPKWHNTLNDKSNIINVTEDQRGEIFVVLDGIENQINQKNPDQTEVTIREKIPVTVTDTGFTYRDGKAFVITVKQFKDLINAEENSEILEKFEKSKGSAILSDEEASLYLEIDKVAKQNIDAKYPEWEATYSELYNLDAYTLPERAKIYQAWKDANRTTSYQQARELTPEEVNKQFGLPKLKAQLKKENPKILTAYETVKKAIPENDQVELENKLLDILNNNEEVSNKITEIIGFYGAKNQLNQLSKGKLNKLANDLPEEKKKEFNDKLNNLIKSKYIDINSGLPKIVQNISNASRDISELLSIYNDSTNTSSWNKNINLVKEVGDITSEILNTIKRITQTNPTAAKELKDKFIGYKNNWQKNQLLGKDLIDELTSFLQYSMKVEDDIANRANEINDLDNAKLEPDEKNKKIDDIKNKPIIKSDKEITHDNWLYTIKHIIDPKKDEKIQDRSYYNAITNKISRLVKTDPTAAHGYSREFNKLLNSLEAKYPEDPQNPEIEAALASFLDTMKDETATPGTLTKTLDTVL